MSTIASGSQGSKNQSVDWLQSAVIYEIFVRSFQDSNGDGVGDLRGITMRLDYLKKTGINAIWLTPIFPSPSYHGYDAIDYRSIHSDFGTLDDFLTLVREAHRRGIKVIIDFAINHTSDLHPWFRDRPNWYCWRNGKINLSHWYYRSDIDRSYYAFFDRHFPDLNLRSESLALELKNTMYEWAERGVDGFRLDAARYYIEGPHGESDTPETHTFLQNLKLALREKFPHVALLAEVWASAAEIAPYLNSNNEVDAAFSFPISGGILTSLFKRNGIDLRAALESVLSEVSHPEKLAPFLANHDMDRVASQVQGRRDRLELAAATLFTLPGPIVLYYGEELGMPNANMRTRLSDDLAKRTPMIWDANLPGHGFTESKEPWIPFSSEDPSLSVEAQTKNSKSLLAFYSSLIRLRQVTPTLLNGDLKLVEGLPPELVGYVRTKGEVSSIVVLNYSSGTVFPNDVSITIAAGSNVLIKKLFGDDRIQIERDPRNLQSAWVRFPKGLRGSSANIVQIQVAIGAASEN